MLLRLLSLLNEVHLLSIRLMRILPLVVHHLTRLLNLVNRSIIFVLLVPDELLRLITLKIHTLILHLWYTVYIQPIIDNCLSPRPALFRHQQSTTSTTQFILTSFGCTWSYFCTYSSTASWYHYWSPDEGYMMIMYQNFINMRAVLYRFMLNIILLHSFQMIVVHELRVVAFHLRS